MWIQTDWRATVKSVPQKFDFCLNLASSLEHALERDKWSPGASTAGACFSIDGSLVPRRSKVKLCGSQKRTWWAVHRPGLLHVWPHSAWGNQECLQEISPLFFWHKDSFCHQCFRQSDLQTFILRQLRQSTGCGPFGDLALLIRLSVFTCLSVFNVCPHQKSRRTYLVYSTCPQLYMLNDTNMPSW